MAQLREAHPGRSLEVDIKGGLIAVGHCGLIEIVLSSLIGDAWKFSAKTEHASIEIGTIKRESKIIYYIRDNGVGFDMKYAEKLFGVFQHLHTQG